MANNSDIEEQILSQIKSYNDSQNQIKNLIESEISTDEPLALYLINDEWLDQWKRYSCFDEIRLNQQLNNIEILKEIRKKKKASQIILHSLKNSKLFINNVLDPLSNFHLITQDCYKILCRNVKKDTKIKFKFEVKNGKLMAKYSDKIIILYKNETKLNLIMFVFPEDSNKKNDFYEQLKILDVAEFLLNLDVEANCEKKDIEIDNTKITFLNKSYSKIKSEEEKFKNVISILINEEFIVFPNLTNSGINNLKLYLINENWLLNFKKSLKYLDTINSKGISGNGKMQTINEILSKYKTNPTLIDNEIINQENALYYYLKEKNSEIYFKLYWDYNLVTEELWSNLIQLFKWYTEIQVNVYIINKNIIVVYNEKDFEIYELSNKNTNNLFFHLYESAQMDQVINEIKNLGINGYYNKYNINISQKNQTYFKLLNNNICFGFAFNINVAKNKINEFEMMIHEQLNDTDLHLGYNAKNNNIPNFDDSSENKAGIPVANVININNNMNNYNLNYNNMNKFNNNNIINNNIENINIQMNNMNINNCNNNFNNIDKNEISMTKQMINNAYIKMNQNEIPSQNIVQPEGIPSSNNMNNQNDTTLQFLQKNYNEIGIKTGDLKTIVEINDSNMNNNQNMNNNMNNYMNQYEMIKNNMYSNINPPFHHANSTENLINPINNFQNFQNQFNQKLVINPINNSMAQISRFAKEDLLKSIVLCFSNCGVLFQNIINYNVLQQNMPVLYSLKYIFQNNDYNTGIQQINVYIKNACKGFLNLEDPKNVFVLLFDNIIKEIGALNLIQNNFVSSNISEDNRDILYDEFVNKIFKPNNYTFISQNFFGIREIISICQSCNSKNYNFEIFKYIEFSIEEVHKFSIEKLTAYLMQDLDKGKDNKFIRKMNSKDINKVTLDYCFDSYLQKTISLNNIFCKKCQNAISKGKYEFRMMPNILFIVINNKQQKDYVNSVKIEEILNLSKYASRSVNQKYDLICAVIYSKEDGKYYSLIKGLNQIWYIQLNNKKNQIDIYGEEFKGFPFLLIYQSKN